VAGVASGEDMAVGDGVAATPVDVTGASGVGVIRLIAPSVGVTVVVRVGVSGATDVAVRVVVAVGPPITGVGDRVGRGGVGLPTGPCCTVGLAVWVAGAVPVAVGGAVGGTLSAVSVAGGGTVGVGVSLAVASGVDATVAVARGTGVTVDTAAATPARATSRSSGPKGRPVAPRMTQVALTTRPTWDGNRTTTGASRSSPGATPGKASRAGRPMDGPETRISA